MILENKVLTPTKLVTANLFSNWSFFLYSSLSQCNESHQYWVFSAYQELSENVLQVIKIVAISDWQASEINVQMTKCFRKMRFYPYPGLWRPKWTLICYNRDNLMAETESWLIFAWEMIILIFFATKIVWFFVTHRHVTAFSYKISFFVKKKLQIAKNENVKIPKM